MTNANTAQARQTKYCNAIKQALINLGHATNNDLLYELRQTYPDLSATTVHRATSRLASRGEISVAPASRDGSMRYDAKIKAHDHFLCDNCGSLMDIDVKHKLSAMLNDSICDCQITGRLVISGICKNCLI